MDDPKGALVSVRGLSKRFGSAQAVREVNLELGAGEVVGFVGPNGAGKTTTLRILAGLLRADAGSGQVLGHDIMTSHGVVSEQVGYMPQRLALYPELTVSQNLRFRADVYGLADARGSVEAAIEDFDLNAYRRRRAGNLSGGWARRLQLAAALIHQPRLVLLDEPTAGLDAETRLDVWRRILDMARGGVSVVINTHDLTEAERCTTVALFSGGRILARGDPDTLTRAEPFEAAMIQADDIDAVAAQMVGMTGVIATAAQGRRLRVLFEPGALETVRARMGPTGVRVEETPKRLEEAAFVITRRAAGSEQRP